MAEDNKEYKGPGKFTAAWGRASVEGAIGSAVGHAAVLSVSKNSRKGLSHRFNLLRGIAGNDEAMQKAEAIAAEIGEAEITKGYRTLKLTAGALALVGVAHGIYKGIKNVGAAKQQVADLNTALDQKTIELEQQKGFVAKLTSERQASASTQVQK